MTETTPTEGSIRVWYIPQVPMEAFEVDVPDLATAQLVLNTLGKFSYFEYTRRVKPDYADFGGIHRYEKDLDGGLDWFEVDDNEIEEAVSVHERAA